MLISIHSSQEQMRFGYSTLGKCGASSSITRVGRGSEDIGEYGVRLDYTIESGLRIDLRFSSDPIISPKLYT